MFGFRWRKLRERFRSPSQPSRLVRRSLGFEQLESRLAPTIGAYTIPPNVTGNLAYAGVVEFGDNDSGTGCTGTLLTDGRHILTAAHCFTLNPDGSIQENQVKVRFDIPTANGGIKQIFITVPRANITLFPGWNGDVNTGNNDIAILTLPELAPYGNGANDLGFSLYTGAADLGSVFSIVGYGFTGTGTTGENRVDAGGGQVQRLTIATGAAGNFNLMFNGESTMEPVNVTANQLATDLQTDDFGPVSVTQVSTAPLSYDITFTNLLYNSRGIVVPAVTVSGNADVSTINFPSSDGQRSEIQRFTLNATAGMFTLSYNGQSRTLAWNASDQEIISALHNIIEDQFTGEDNGFRRVDVYVVPGTADRQFEIDFRNLDYPKLNPGNLPLLQATPGPGGLTGTVSAQLVIRADVIQTKLQSFNIFNAQTAANGNLIAFLTQAAKPGLPGVQGILGAGDSGGPAFVGNQIAGVASSGNGTSQFGNYSDWARVPFFLNFINSAIAPQPYDALLNLNDQPDAGNGVPKNVFVQEIGGQVTVTINGVLYFTESLQNLRSLTIMGETNPTTVTANVNFTFPLTVLNATFKRAPQPVQTLYAVGSGPGQPPEVKVFNLATKTLKLDFLAYAASFSGGVRVALGDYNGDRIPDIFVSPGPGMSPEVKVFSGKDGSVLYDALVFGVSFTGGVFVAAGDVNGDSLADIVVGTDAGAAPEVKVLAGGIFNGQLMFDFLAYSASFTGGVRVGAGDVNGDGYADIITGTGPGAAPEVKVFGGGPLNTQKLRDFLAYDAALVDGIFVAAGDVNKDGLADVMTGAGGAPHVKVFDAKSGGLLQSFFAFAPTFNGGVTVGTLDTSPGGQPRLIVGAGPTGAPGVRILDALSLALLDDFFAYNSAFAGGVFVAGS